MRPVNLDLDPEAVQLDNLADQVRQEAEALHTILSMALDVQWTATPTVQASDDTADRVKHRAIDPTGEIACDLDRLALRDQILQSQHVLRDAVVALRGVRRGLERALRPWQGGGGA